MKANKTGARAIATPTDEDITRALARLAGFDGETWIQDVESLYRFKSGKGEYFSPLTDWRDLGPLLPLLYKARYQLRYELEGMYRWYTRLSVPVTPYCTNFMRADCLALYHLEQEQ